MSTTAEKLQRIQNIKNDLKEKINAKGGSITDTTPFAEYSIQVENISGGNSYDYVVTFINWNGDILQTNYVMSGDSVTYEGATPTKSVDDDYIYIFSGWSNDTTNVTSDVVAIAEFEQKECTVIRLNLTDSNYLQPTINIQNISGGTVDWGDGEISTITKSNYSRSFTKPTPYASTGEYTIDVVVDGRVDTTPATKISLDTNVTPTYRQYITYWKYQPGIYTYISENAFRRSKQLTSITIPESITSFEYSYNALWMGSETNKATITFKATTPPIGLIHGGNGTINKDYLQEIRVPASAVDAYKSATNWSTFGDYIVGYEPEDQITITENGTYDVTNKTTAIVNVESSGGEGSTDMLQARVDATNSCDYLFYNYTGDNVDFISGLDTSNVKTMGSMYYNCRNLKTVPQLETSNVTDMISMHYNCSNLKTIPILNVIKVISPSGLMRIVTGCTNLTNLTILNIRINLQIGSGSGTSSSDWGHLLTLDSLLNTIKELIDTGSSKTLTMGSGNLDKLANVYVKLTGEPEEDETLPKLPFVVCESTDEGAMLITDYVTLKNWSIAA